MLVNGEIKMFSFCNLVLCKQLFKSASQSLQLNFCNIIDKLISLRGTQTRKHIHCVITRCVMCWLSNENKGASRFQVQEHPIFPGTKIFTLWAFLCVVGAGLTSLLWNLLPTFPCVTDWQVIMPCDWLPKMTANQSQIRMGFLSSAWEKLLLGCYILIS